MILVFGSINVDLVARVAAIPRPGETVLAPGHETSFGGKGANQAVAAARVSSPGRVAMVGRVGDDAFGRACRANLEANGVAVDGIDLGAEPTGCAFIVVDAAGENAITVASGANGALEAPAGTWGAMAAPTTLVLQIEVPLAPCLAVAGRVRAAGGRVVWNLAPVPAGFTSADLAAVLEVTSLLVVNEHEALAAAGLLDPTVVTPDASGRLLATRCDVACIVTAGSQGAFAVPREGSVTHVAAPRIAPVDTTGAGDTFVGILAAGLDEGRPLPEAMARACRGAALACLAAGAQSAMPRAADLV